MTHRIKFIEEARSYEIVAGNSRYLICAKPFAARNTFLYCFVDLKEKRRGPDNYLFGYDSLLYNDPEDAKKALELLENGTIELSPRRSIELNVEWIKSVPRTYGQIIKSMNATVLEACNREVK